MENNNVGYSVNGINAPRKVSRAAKRLGTFSLICGIISVALPIIKALRLLLFIVIGGIFFRTNNFYWIWLIPISFSGTGNAGIVLGAIALGKDKKNIIGIVGLVLSIIGVVISLLLALFALKMVVTMDPFAPIDPRCV